MAEPSSHCLRDARRPRRDVECFDFCELAGSSSDPRQLPTARPGCRLRIARIG